MGDNVRCITEYCSLIIALAILTYAIIDVILFLEGYLT